jgi:hypothetical protein
MSSPSFALAQQPIAVELSLASRSETFVTTDPSVDNTGYKYRLIKKTSARDRNHCALISARFIWGGNDPRQIDQIFRSIRFTRLPWWNSCMQGTNLKAMISLEQRAVRWFGPRRVNGKWREGYWLKYWCECEDPRFQR